MPKQRVLMLMLEVGFGHKAPANAVKEAIEARYPGRFRVDVVDFAKEVGALADDKLLKNGWDLALAFPLSARIGYLWMELNRRNLSYVDALYKDFIEKGVAYIEDRKPDLIFATHALCLYIAGKAKLKFGLATPIVAYVVDPFDGYSLWADENADKILVATEQSRKRLVDHGIDDAKIVKTGFPINNRFFDVRKSTEDITKELALVPGWPTLLVSAGGQGIGKVFSFVEAAHRLQLPLNIVTVAGKNQKTKARMEKLAASGKSETHLVPLGYVTNMNELIRACDVVVGKSGASTFMEAVFMGKPVIFTEWATYNDWYIVNFALDNDIGWYCPSVISFVGTLRRLLEPGALDPFASRIAALGMVPGADEVAEYLTDLLVPR
ncbi:MAG TPA: glycosyltransferase [Rectinemataceae bacterium]|nr:glycosyltransferase [Rectinemataceae bacterium]